MAKRKTRKGSPSPTDPRAAMIKAVQTDLAQQRKQIEAAQQTTKAVILQAQKQAMEQSKHYAQLAQKQLQQATSPPGQSTAPTPAQAAANEGTALPPASVSAAQSLEASKQLSQKAMQFSQQQIDSIVKQLNQSRSST